MKKAEIIIALISFFGLMLFSNGIPFGSFILILSLSLIAILYVYFNEEIFNNKEISESFKNIRISKLRQRKFNWSTLLGYSISSACMGILFVIMNWPGSSAMLLISSISLVLNLFFAINKYYKNKNNYHLEIMNRLIIYAFLSVFFLLS